MYIFLLSQKESLKGWKQEIKNSLNSLKYYISAVFSQNLLKVLCY